MMKTKIKYSAFLAIFLIFSIALSCKEETDTKPNLPGEVTLNFDHVVGTSTLSLDDQEYTNANGDKFKVSRFKYYISNIIFKMADGTEYTPSESYYLIDESLPASKAVTIKDVPAGQYTNLVFTIGVDSLRNVSGVQTGALDPANGMFWTWNTGYVFVKLEGTSPQSQNGGLVFHIGGFNRPNNTIRTISPALNGQKILVEAGKTPQIQLKVNVLNMFQGTNLVNFAELSTTMGGANSVKIADNYRNMFTIDHIQN